jgi:hypothetical protein|nr:MAG TPA: hypothetical protein [Caudoviricetes sp.]
MFREISRPEGQEVGLYMQPKPEILENVNVDKSINIDAPLVSESEEESSVMDDIFESILYGLIDCADGMAREALEEQRRNN